MGRIARVVLCVLLPWVAAGEPPHPDFSGRWVVDLRASDPVDPLLRATGHSWLERRLATFGRPWQEITQTDAAIVVHGHSALLDRTETLTPDGSPMVTHDLHGDPVTTHTAWSPDGAALVTEGDLPSARGGGHLCVVRTLEDGGQTLRQRWELHTGDGRLLVAARVYRRDEPR